MPTTTSSALFSGANALEHPHRQVGVNIIPFNDTIPTTELGEALDRRRLTPIAEGLELIAIYYENADLDSGAGALVADIVLADAAGDTVLAAGGATFASANTGKWVFITAQPRVKGKTAEIVFKTTTAASTPAAGAVKGFIVARG